MQTDFPSIVLDTLASESNEVDSMVERINSAILKRANYERAKKPNGSHVELRRAANAFADSRLAAAFFVALNVDPDLMFNRTRKEGTRTNLKGLKKVRALIDYVMGRKDSLDIVSKALFASTIIAAKMGVQWIASPEQELILSSERVGSLPKDIQSAIRAYQHKHMTIEGDSRNQSCQFRTTFSNMGMYSFSREDFDDCDYTMGICVNLSNPLIEYLANRWNLGAY